MKRRTEKKQAWREVEDIMRNIRRSRGAHNCLWWRAQAKLAYEATQHKGVDKETK